MPSEIIYCLDCNKIIDFRYSRCKSCAKKGKLHPNWKGGKPNCINCNKKLKDRRSKKCKSCSMKYRLKNGLAKRVSECRKSKRNSIKTEFKKGHKHSKETIMKLSLSSGGTGIPYENALYNENIFTKELKYKIFKRDNFTCQLCTSRNGKLTCHHIDYNKKNCKENNLITLCNRCNSKVNFNRNYWEIIFQEKLLCLQK